MAFNTQPLSRLMDDEQAMNHARDVLRERAMIALNDAVRDAALDLVRTHGVDQWTARLVVATLAVDGARALQAVAAADARDMGVPVRAAAQAMGYASATPLQRDGDKIRAVQEGRDQATTDGKPVTIDLYGWSYTLPPSEPFEQG